MKIVQFIIGGILLAGIGAGIVVIIKSSASSSGDDAAGAAADKVESVVSVRTGTLKRMTLHGYVSGYGVVEAAPATANEPASGATLASPAAGIVAKVNVVAGQHVEKGEVLVQLNSAAVTFDYAKEEVDRQTQLFAQANTSRKNLQDAQAQLASLQVVAPVSGTVTKLSARAGEAIDAGAAVAEVMDLNRLAIAAKIAAKEAGPLKPGAEVEVSSEPAVTASLAVLNPGVNSSDGTISVWATLPANSGLRPGEFLPLRIVSVTHTNCLAAPADSVVKDGTGQSVVAIVKGDEATQMPVDAGLSEAGWVEISVTNLNEGDTVVTTGAYGLPAKTKIRAADSSEDHSSAKTADAK